MSTLWQPENYQSAEEVRNEQPFPAAGETVAHVFSPAQPLASPAQATSKVDTEQATSENSDCSQGTGTSPSGINTAAAAPAQAAPAVRKRPHPFLRLVAGVVLLAFILLGGISTCLQPVTDWYGAYNRQKARSATSGCVNNLIVLSTELDNYAQSHGRYPQSLDEVSSQREKIDLHCPACGQTYYEGYQCSPDGLAYTLVCRGANHQEAGLPDNFPRARNDLRSAPAR